MYWYVVDLRLLKLVVTRNVSFGEFSYQVTDNALDRSIGIMAV